MSKNNKINKDISKEKYTKDITNKIDNLYKNNVKNIDKINLLTQTPFIKSKKLWIPLITTLGITTIIVPSTIVGIKNKKKHSFLQHKQDLTNNFQNLITTHNNWLNDAEVKTLQQEISNDLQTNNINNLTNKINHLNQILNTKIQTKQNYLNQIKNPNITTWLDDMEVKSLYHQIVNQLQNNDLNDIDTKIQKLEQLCLTKYQAKQSFLQHKQNLTNNFQNLITTHNDWLNDAEVKTLQQEISNDLQTNNIDNVNNKINQLKQVLNTKIQTKQNYLNQIKNPNITTWKNQQNVLTLYSIIINKLQNNDLNDIDTQIQELQQLCLVHNQTKEELKQEFDAIKDKPSKDNFTIIYLKNTINSNLNLNKIDVVKTQLEELKQEFNKELEKQEFDTLYKNLDSKIKEYRSLNLEKIINQNEKNTFEQQNWYLNHNDTKSQILQKTNDINNWISKYNNLITKQNEFNDFVSNLQPTRFNEKALNAKIYQLKQEITSNISADNYINQLNQINQETYLDKLNKIKDFIQQENGYLNEQHWQEFIQFKNNNPDDNFGMDLTPYDLFLKKEQNKIINVEIPLEQQIKWQYYIYELNKIKEYYNKNGELFWQINKRIDFFIEMIKIIFTGWRSYFNSPSANNPYSLDQNGESSAYFIEKPSNYVFSLEETEFISPEISPEIQDAFINNGISMGYLQQPKPISNDYYLTRWFGFDYEKNKTKISPEISPEIQDYGRDREYRSLFLNYTYFTNWIKYYNSPEIQSMVIDMNNSIGEINDNDVIALNDYKKYENTNPLIAQYLQNRTNFIFEEGGDFYKEPKEYSTDVFSFHIKQKYLDSFFKGFWTQNQNYFNNLKNKIKFSSGDIFIDENLTSLQKTYRYENNYPFSQFIYWNESDYQKYAKYVNIDSEFRLNENKATQLFPSENILSTLLFTQPNFFSSSFMDFHKEHLDPTLLNQLKTIEELKEFNKNHDHIYINPLEEYKEWIEKWKKILPKIIDKNWTNEQKIKAVMFYICTNTYYYSNDSGLSFGYGSFYANGKNITNSTTIFDQDLRSIECVGYSRNLSIALTLLNIPVRIVGGITNKNGQDAAHSWNEVFLDGRWKVIDLTNTDFSENLHRTTYDIAKLTKLDPASDGSPAFEMNPNRLIFERNDDYIIANYKLGPDSYILTIINYPNPDEYEYPYLPRSIYANGPSWVGVDFTKEKPFLPKIITREEAKEYRKLHKNDPIDSDFDSALNWKRPKNYLG
ncbi:hypothetical protein GE118_03645 [Mycoplasma sp. NEAQ87857]|uniref:transglutaminase domain-containing protein n=1 Tax=Mycoplasma sp. NEAQ87857 TaxID=2683967 RepID=UPI001317AE83|nr:transglutaminase domain-containing protein [Mycoplasma sp. NEAQ87857]QGZ97876.1 hypothetical protein GE118_03645 [Mycoplasma sp. NEAQ87857]